MAKTIKLQSKVECKINGAPKTFTSSELVIELKDAPKKQVERKSIPYHKPEPSHKRCCSRHTNLCNLLLAMLMKIFK